MIIKHIDKQYVDEPLESILSDYLQALNNETGGEYIQVSSVQIYIDGGTPVFFNHIFADSENPIELMVEDLRSIIEPEFSQDKIYTVVSTVKFDN